MTASLPLDDSTRDIVAKGYYRDRKTELLVCSSDERGETIERVGYAVGMIVKVGLEENVVTFTAEDDTFDGVEEKDERRWKTIEDVRSQFKRELLGAASAGDIGWSMNLFTATAGNGIGVGLDVLGLVRPPELRAGAAGQGGDERLGT